MQTFKEEHLGTVFSITVPDGTDVSFCFLELQRIEKKYSRFLSENYLQKLNSCVGQWCAVDEETHYLLSFGVKIEREFTGIFSMSVKEQLEHLGYGSRTVVSPAHIQDISCELRNGEVRLRAPIEFGSFGKGYAINRLVTLLDLAGVQRFFINGGGDVFARGQWPVHLEHPLVTTHAIGTAHLCDSALCASSSNRRVWQKDGRRVHHLLSKYADELLMVYVRAKQAMQADAYATALFCCGIDAIEYSKKYGVLSLLVTAEQKIYVAPEFEVELFK